MTETTAALILAQMATGKISLTDAMSLYNAADSALAVLEHRNDIRQIVPEATDKLTDILKGDISSYEHRAIEEQEWCKANNVRILTLADKDYPTRLRHCPDGPLVLFARGKTDFNAAHIISIVGTRNCTSYGKDVVSKIVRDLAQKCPDVMIVSGLAYGIDINAHRAAMYNHLATVGVVAHGEDTLYPSLHRQDANNIILNGGAVVTEYFKGTTPEGRNFLQRNRIIAGMSDATIIIESAVRGGGLATIRLALDYGREAMAVPGPINAAYSAGCNCLIRDSKAALVTSAEDIMNILGWQDMQKVDKARKQGIERSLFVELDDTERILAEALAKNGDRQPNDLAIITGLPISSIISTLFTLEMKGVVALRAGNVYHLIG